MPQLNVNSEGTLNYEQPTGEAFEFGADSPEWKTALRMMRKTERAKREKVDECRKIQDEFEDQFSLVQKGAKKFLSGSMMFNVIWRSLTRIKPLSFTVRLHGAPKEFESIVQDTLEQAVEKSGLLSSFTAKFGAAFRMFLFGDSFIRKGIREGEGFPSRFENFSIQDAYFDPFALEIDNDTSYQDSDEIALRYVYSRDEFNRIYPDYADKVANGVVPVEDVDENAQETLSHTFDQKNEMDDDEIEVLHWYKKSLDLYVIFAGANATIIERLEGADYPFRKSNGTTELPVYQFMCFPSTKGFYNYGLGNLFYRLHIQEKQLMNMAIAAIRDRVDPVYFMRISKTYESEIRNNILKALQDKAKGGMGIVPLGKDASGNEKASPIQSLIGEVMTQEFERLFSQYDLMVKRIGINLDDVPQANVDTVGQAQLREEAANSFVKQIMENNGHEFKRIYEGLLTDIRDYVDASDPTPVRSNRSVKADDGGEVQLTTTTLGAVSEVLNKYDFEVVVDARSGSYPDVIAELARSKDMLDTLSQLAPGSPAHLRQVVDFAKLRGRSISEDELQLPQAQ